MTLALLVLLAVVFTFVDASERLATAVLQFFSNDRVIDVLHHWDTLRAELLKLQVPHDVLLLTIRRELEILRIEAHRDELLVVNCALGGIDDWDVGQSLRVV